MKKFLPILLFLLLFNTIYAQESGTKGTEFWLAYMENLTLAFNGDPQFSIYVSAEESGEATITAAATGLEYSFSYDANTVTEFNFPPNILYATGSEAIKNFGFRINTTSPTNITAVHYRVFFSEASIVLPVEILDNEYIILAGKDFNNSTNSPSSFVIVATEDNTEVEITPSANTAELRPAGIPFSITLNAGNSYQVHALGDLTGSKIRSLNESKIAVFAGAQQADIACDLFADNHLYDQAYPISYGAKEYALIPFKGQGLSLFKFLALEDDTEIYINSSLFTTLQSGEYSEELYDTPQILTSSKNIFVAQFNPSQGCNLSQLGDPTMITLHSSNYRTKKVLFGFNGSQAFSQRNITLFTETENIDDIKIDDVNISDEFQEFPNYPSFSYATITKEAGSSLLEAPRGVFAYCYGLGDFDAYSYTLGFNPNSEVSTYNIDPSLITIFPNPSTNFIKINSTKIISHIELLTIEGNIILSKTPKKESTSFDLTQLSDGIYFVKIYSADNVSIKRIVKQ